jgi:two-component system CheB/CheR fusion protein
MPPARPSVASREPPVDPSLETLLEYLKAARGFDFTGYKRASLARRIDKRMKDIGVEGHAAYVDYLEVHPEEFAELFNTILINVTSFFRDEPTWEVLTTRILPELIEKKGDAPIRVWSAGCATGQEAYSLAMAFAELLGAEAFRERVKIYATDADDEALTQARTAQYSEREVAGVAPHLLGRYFDHDNGRYTFNKEARRQVIFGRHDLVQDAPISRVDLLVCRNVLMYFDAETQTRILARFHFALNAGGLLVLGRAETLLSHNTTFAPVDLKRRISMKISRGALSLRDRMLLTSQSGEAEESAGIGADLRLRDAAMDAAPAAQIVVDAGGILRFANDRARSTFGLTFEDVGRPLQDLRLSYRPVELRSLIDQVHVERRLLLVRDVEMPSVHGRERCWFELQLAPLSGSDGSTLGVSVAFVDVTTAKRLQHDTEQLHQELEAAYEELQSTNEELETTNEELQSTVEELETTNEELQSTNEELETMNEELHSTNEELSAINDELRVRGTELNRVNMFMESILGSLRGGVVVLDADQHVLVWNDKATELWGLRDEEVLGRHFLGLDIGLPVDELRHAVKSCLGGATGPIEHVLDATNRRGRPIRCRITCSPLISNGKQLHGVILVMETVDEDTATSAGSTG